MPPIQVTAHLHINETMTFSTVALSIISLQIFISAILLITFKLAIAFEANTLTQAVQLPVIYYLLAVG